MVSCSRILELYYAIRMAFNQNYDFFKYRGKTGRQYDGENSQHAHLLKRLQNKFPTEEELTKHFAFNVLYNNPWITKIASEECLRITAEYQRMSTNIPESLSDVFSGTLKTYSDTKGFKKLITETEFGAPLFNLLLGGKIHFSVFAWINSVTNCSNKWKSYAWLAAKKNYTLTEKIMNISKEDKLLIAKTLKEMLDQSEM